jgi:hypothetical protein
MNAKNPKSLARFAICVDTDDPDLLTPRMVYQVLPDEIAVKSDYLRVIDNEGEDYLYPAKYFVLIDLPQQVEQALLSSKRTVMRSIDTGRDELNPTEGKGP